MSTILDPLRRRVEQIEREINERWNWDDVAMPDAVAIVVDPVPPGSESLREIWYSKEAHALRKALDELNIAEEQAYAEAMKGNR